jgi:hypothetical protein
MSSPPSHGGNPRPRSPSSSSSIRNGQRGDASGTPRSSLDHTRPYQMEASSSSASRRASQSSIHHSPTSSHHTSHLAHEYLPDAASNNNNHVRRYNGESSSSPRLGPSGSGGQIYGNAGGGDRDNILGQPQPQSSRLPRITTSNVDRYQDTSAPHSAPSASSASGSGSGSLRPNGQHQQQYNVPLRSASSPDPWQSSSGTPHNRGSPSSSPIDGSRPSVILGPPAHPFPIKSPRGPSPSGSLGSNRERGISGSNAAPPSVIPPRGSSFIDSERGIASRSSQQSLTDTSGTDHSVPSNPPSLTFPVPQTRSRRGETYCGQCAQVVHGQFVCAMGHVYHLNCFRCKVSYRFLSRIEEIWEAE